MPTAKLLGFFHFCTVTLHLMANDDPLSAIVLIVIVNQLPINIVVDRGGTIKLFASHAKNSQSGTARLFLLFLYCIDIMFMFFVRGITKHA